MPANEETPDAKFARIAEEIRTNVDWRALLAGTYDDELAALDEIAKRYGGESWNTGGGIYVAVVPLGPHDAMGVTGECVGRCLACEGDNGSSRANGGPIPCRYSG